jgi:hypothetical protein
MKMAKCPKCGEEISSLIFAEKRPVSFEYSLWAGFEKIDSGNQSWIDWSEEKE